MELNQLFTTFVCKKNAQCMNAQEVYINSTYIICMHVHRYALSTNLINGRGAEIIMIKLIALVWSLVDVHVDTRMN